MKFFLFLFSVVFIAIGLGGAFTSDWLMILFGFLGMAAVFSAAILDQEK